VLLAGLSKLRSQVSDDNGLFQWIDLVLRRVEINMPVTKLPGLAALVRQLDPARINNVVAPGRVGTAGSASVVYLTREAAAMFTDLRDDAVLGSAVADTTTTSSSTPPSSTASTASTVPTSTSTTRPSTTTTAPGFVGIVPTTTTTTAVTPPTIP
jgi:hypothetical protein